MENENTANLPKVDDKKLEEMFKAGVQFGYSRSRRHPKMKAFISGVKNNIELFDLNLVWGKLEKAKEFLKKLGEERKNILIVGTKAEVSGAVEQMAKELNMPYVTERWVGGTLTNFKGIRTRVDHMVDLMKKKETGELGKYTKKERSILDRKLKDLNRFFSGIESLKGLPSAMIIIDSNKEVNAIDEAKQLAIPVIAIMNSDCNLADAEHYIPGNDNSSSSVTFFLKELTSAFKEGLAK